MIYITLIIIPSNTSTIKQGITKMGNSTNHQDHVITPVSFSVINTRVSNDVNDKPFTITCKLY